MMIAQLVGRLANRIPVGAIFATPVQIGPRAHPASCTMGIGSPKKCWGVALTNVSFSSC